MAIAEQTADACLGNESGEPVQVLEELEFGHRQSMTRIPPEGKSCFLRKSRGFCPFEAKNYPLESRKSLKNNRKFRNPPTSQWDVENRAVAPDREIQYPLKVIEIVLAE